MQLQALMKLAGKHAPVNPFLIAAMVRLQQQNFPRSQTTHIMIWPAEQCEGYTSLAAHVCKLAETSKASPALRIIPATTSVT
jgi:hypothetical protein